MKELFRTADIGFYRFSFYCWKLNPSSEFSLYSCYSLPVSFLHVVFFLWRSWDKWMYGFIFVSLASNLAQCLAQSRHSINLFLNVLNVLNEGKHSDHPLTLTSTLTTDSIYEFVLNEQPSRDYFRSISWVCVWSGYIKGRVLKFPYNAKDFALSISQVPYTLTE